jgi:hypothetical protein
MNDQEPQSDLGPIADALTHRLFAERGQTLHSDANQKLMTQGQPQHRLYLIRNGFVVGYRARASGKPDQVMRAGTGDLVGVQSFFGGVCRSFMTIVALVPTELVFIERHWQPPAPHDPLEQQLMPAVIHELTRRQQTIIDMARQQVEVDARMRELERTSALGQLAAGVAHELNNAMTVIARGAEWVNGTIADHFADDPRRAAAFGSGIRLGRSVSTAQARDRAEQLRRRYKLSFARARKLAQTGLDDAALNLWHPLDENLQALIDLWELGATLNDLQVAARQAEYVVQSMRDLGRPAQRRTTDVSLRQTFQIALQILRNATRGIEIVEDIEDQLPRLRASRGELVQVWTNLIKNAADAMRDMDWAGDARPTIVLRARRRGGDIVVDVDDNGPGIPDSIIERIFEPSFTTKKTGLSFGLGLGLSIVLNIVTGYGGRVDVLRDHTPGATFRVTLPIGVERDG